MSNFDIVPTYKFGEDFKIIEKEKQRKILFEKHKELIEGIHQKDK